MADDEVIVVVSVEAVATELALLTGALRFVFVCKFLSAAFPCLFWHDAPRLARDARHDGPVTERGDSTATSLAVEVSLIMVDGFVVDWLWCGLE